VKFNKIIYKKLTNKIVNIKFLKNFSFNLKYYLIKRLFIILFKFHVNKKKILFFGLPLHTFNFIKTLKLKTRHTFVKNDCVLNGSFSNYLAIKYFFTTNKNSKKFFNIKTKTGFNLFVNFSCINKEIMKTSLIIININEILKLKLSVPIYVQFFFHYLLIHFLLKHF